MAQQPSIVDDKVLVYGQMFLRLLGVMMFVDGLATGGFSLIYGTLVNRANGIDAPFFYDITSAGYLGQSAVYLAVGFYLASGGDWVVQKILAPSRRRAVVPARDE